MWQRFHIDKIKLCWCNITSSLSTVTSASNVMRFYLYIVIYIILVYSSSFLKVDNFLDTNMTVQYCVEDVKKLSRNANCTIIIKEGIINQTDKFDQQKCVSMKILETPHSMTTFLMKLILMMILTFAIRL